MSERVILLIIPGLREDDLARMPELQRLAADAAPLAHSFPGLSAVVQTSMTTGLLPRDHGVVSHGAFDRDCSLWSPKTTTVQTPAERVWTTIRAYIPEFRCKLIGLEPIAADHQRSSVDWFQQCPTDVSQTTVDVVEEAVSALRLGNHLLIARLLHLDGAGHVYGPESDEFAAMQAKLNEEIGELFRKVTRWATQMNQPEPLWIVATEYVIHPVNQCVQPNRVLQQLGWLTNTFDEHFSGEEAVLGGHGNLAWATGEYQCAHVFLADCPESPPAEGVALAFQDVDGVAEVLQEKGKQRRDLNHPNSGDLVLIAEPNATFDCSVGLVGDLPRGTHGSPAEQSEMRGVILASEPGVLFGSSAMADFDVAGIVLRQFGI
ncbi:MAG: alkaline phosphatase family protein [Pirellulales bacterium]|nr:alkaline phosphatase family protein [Pirellulales bacterium]